tara:strand:- start:19509 stop:19874 length:366 start_codon:yes stop_codon:yes gene_type:complete
MTGVAIQRMIRNGPVPERMLLYMVPVQLNGEIDRSVELLVRMVATVGGTIAQRFSYPFASILRLPEYFNFVGISLPDASAHMGAKPTIFVFYSDPIRTEYINLCVPTRIVHELFTGRWHQR